MIKKQTLEKFLKILKERNFTKRNIDYMIEAIEKELKIREEYSKKKESKKRGKVKLYEKKSPNFKSSQKTQESQKTENKRFKYFEEF